MYGFGKCFLSVESLSFQVEGSGVGRVARGGGLFLFRVTRRGHGGGIPILHLQVDI